MHTSVPPVGPKNLDMPCSVMESMPKAETTSPEGASGMSKSSSSSIFRLFILLSDRRGWGSLDDLACKIASASSSWCTRSLILAIRRWRCSVAASTKLGGEWVCGRESRTEWYSPSSLAGGETPFTIVNSIVPQIESRSTTNRSDITQHIRDAKKTLGSEREGSGARWCILGMTGREWSCRNESMRAMSEMTWTVCALSERTDLESEE